MYWAASTRTCCRRRGRRRRRADASLTTGRHALFHCFLRCFLDQNWARQYLPQSCAFRATPERKLHFAVSNGRPKPCVVEALSCTVNESFWGWGWAYMVIFRPLNYLCIFGAVLFS